MYLKPMAFKFIMLFTAQFLLSLKTFRSPVAVEIFEKLFKWPQLRDLESGCGKDPKNLLYEKMLKEVLSLKERLVTW